MSAKVGRPAAPSDAAAVLTYEQTRDREQLAVHARELDEFIRRYKNAARAPQRQTLFFLPGGMACQLKRSEEAFRDGVASPSFSYSFKWLNCGTFSGGALQLGMEEDSDGVFRDKGNRIVVADGAVNLGGHTPHDGLIDWCADNNVDLFVFNWDWRRRQEDAARFFVEQFWPLFENKTASEGIAAAAANFSLLGHSFGGMVVNLILRGNDRKVAQHLKRAITVATPFYGYASQVHRWFEGEPYLNGDNNRSRKAMIEVIASMPGLYALHYLDLGVTFRRDQGALAEDQQHMPAYSLAQYPNRDASTGAPLDPWDQQLGSGGRIRYPVNLGFRLGELQRALRAFREMAAPIRDGRFFNIRGVRLAPNRGTARRNTVGSVTCGWIPGNYNPKQESPIRDGAKVPGDGTQPAWTARLVTNDPARCLTVEGENVEHMFLMSDPGTLKALASILLEAAAGMSRIRRRRPPRLATGREVLAYLDWLHAYRRGKSGRALSEASILDAIPAKLKRRLPRIARRIIADILKRPVLSPT